MAPMPCRVGVVGAGVSGLAFAHRLVVSVLAGRSPAGASEQCPAQGQDSAGLHIKIFEWGRGPGGRLARKRSQIRVGGASRTLFFDHGCPFFDLGDDQLTRLLSGEDRQQGGGTRGVLDRCVEGIDGGRSPAGKTFVGVPESNNAIVKAFVQGIEDMRGSNAAGPRVEVEYLYQRHVLRCSAPAGAPGPREEAPPAPGGAPWRLTCSNLGSGHEEDHDLDVLVLTDKLLFLHPNAYSVIDLGSVLSGAEHGYLSSRLAGARSSDPRLVLLLALRMPRAAFDHARGLGVRLDAGAQPAAGEGPVEVDFLVHETAKPGRAAAPFAAEGDDSVVAQFTVHSTPRSALANMVYDTETGEGRLKPDTAGGPDVQDRVIGEMTGFSLKFLAQLLSGGATEGSARRHGHASYPGPEDVVSSQLFVWDHAVVSAAAGNSAAAAADSALHWWSSDRGLGLAGDYWGRGSSRATASDVESAILSGLGLADAVAGAAAGSQCSL